MFDKKKVKKIKRGFGIIKKDLVAFGAEAKKAAKIAQKYRMDMEAKARARRLNQLKTIDEDIKYLNKKKKLLRAKKALAEEMKGSSLGGFQI